MLHGAPDRQQAVSKHQSRGGRAVMATKAARAATFVMAMSISTLARIVMAARV